MALGTFLQFHTEKFGEEKNLKQLLSFFFWFVLCLFVLFWKGLNTLKKRVIFFSPLLSVYIFLSGLYQKTNKQ